MMIARVNFFKYYLIRYATVLFIVFTFLGCNSAKLTHQAVYKGFSWQGSHARSLSVVNNVIAVGGKGGQITFFALSDTAVSHAVTVSNAEDFRDIHLSPNGNVIALNSGNKGEIYRLNTENEFELSYQKDSVFLDGMDFWKDSVGIAYGDPEADHFFLLKSTNSGLNWKELKPSIVPVVLSNEAAFAASGTGIQALSDSIFYFGTGGGSTARLFCTYDQGNTWIPRETPVKSGGTYGIYSIFFTSPLEGFVIGGSYQDTTYNKTICQYTNNGGLSWKNRSKGLNGYCSCIQGSKNGELIVATGRMGTYYSLNKGKKWNLLTLSPYYTCKVTDKHIILSGKNGSFEIINYELCH